jgi:hypothetical protein
MIYGQGWAHMPSAVNFYNNIICPSPGGNGGFNGDFNVPALSLIANVDRNLYPSDPVYFGVGNSGSTFTTLSAWQAATQAAGHSADANSHQANPDFVGSGTEAAYYILASGSPALTLAADGGEIGAWRGTSQVGCSFGGGTVVAIPDAPHMTSVS